MSGSINRVTLVGNVSSDVKVTSLTSGGKVANFSLATNSRYKDKEGNVVDKAQFHKLVCFSPMADNIEKFVRKGSKLLIEGGIEYREYEKEGEKKYVTEIKVTSFTLLDRKEKDSEQE